MWDISINWKKITRGLSRGKRYANDRIPTLEEVRKIVEYPDRRIKPIVYIMCSSGIRLGAWDYLIFKQADINFGKEIGSLSNNINYNNKPKHHSIYFSKLLEEREGDRIYV